MPERRKPGPKPWFYNTYFLFAIALAVIGVIGFLKGAKFIMDPGQIKDVDNPIDYRLPWLYIGAAVLFAINGFVSHTTHLKEFREAMGKVEQTDA